MHTAQHPLLNQSLAPKVFRSQEKMDRLKFKPDYGVNRENIIVKLWDEVHRRSVKRPYPLRIILHEILLDRYPDLQKIPGDFDFEGHRYAQRDILVAGYFMQWLGTNVGNAFFEEISERIEADTTEEVFLEKFLEQKRQSVLPVMLHECTSHCTPRMWSPGFGDGHDYRNSCVSARDEAVCACILLWLGTLSGMEFTRMYFGRVNQADEASRASMKAKWAKTSEQA